MLKQLFKTKKPNIFQIEVSAICNLACPLCHNGRNEIERDSYLMEFDQFKGIIDEIYQDAQYIYLHMWGEPTINGRLIDMIEYIKKKNDKIITNVSTNANYISTNEYVFSLLRSGLKQLIVSIDGIDQDSYAKYRINGLHEKCLAFLKYASEAKQAFDLDTLIIAQCLTISTSGTNYETFKNVVDYPGVEAVFKPLYIGGYKDDYLDYVDHNSKIQKPTLADCTALDSVLAIQSDGYITPCCLHPNRPTGFDLGNIFTDGYRSILNHNNRKNFSSSIKKNIPPTDVCRMSCNGGLK